MNQNNSVRLDIEAIAEGKKRWFKSNKDYCKCGHKKNKHQPTTNGEIIECQEYIYHEKSRKMIQCGCEI